MRHAPDLLFRPSVLAVVQALLPAQTRAVGGAVRSVLLSEPMAHVEVDLATDIPPDEMAVRLRRAGMRFDEAGARWGSLAVASGDEVIDVTSLREDSYLPGSRYPAVRWVNDWALDAARRDFTIGAIYMSPDGALFDPYGGEADLKARVVRFIGDPAQRLREDPLRLLRFFRFCGQYGLAGFTDELKPVLAQAVPAVASLSRVRVAKELEKLSHTPHAVSVGRAMEEVGLKVG
ncbi:MAG: CCA tRNA nucleotidyltransferase [Pseudomonadaceae bacterium]|nr:CCA tRNA nucleotidyltransferase [Pseudomonadaceae bacterium]